MTGLIITLSGISSLFQRMPLFIIICITSIRQGHDAVVFSCLHFLNKSDSSTLDLRMVEFIEVTFLQTLAGGRWCGSGVSVIQLSGWAWVLYRGG